MTTTRYIAGVATLELDAEKCTGCGLCAEVCPHGVFAVAEGKARILDRDACIECGACAKNCPAEAVTVRAGVGCAVGIIKGAACGCEPCCGPGKSKCC